jgi:hypothetical protein
MCIAGTVQLAASLMQWYVAALCMHKILQITVIDMVSYNNDSYCEAAHIEAH